MHLISNLKYKMMPKRSHFLKLTQNKFWSTVDAYVKGTELKILISGLIHLSQSITQHTCLHHLYKEPFDLECCVVEYRTTERGVEVDCFMKVYDRREMCIWEGVTTLLSRKMGSHKSRTQLYEDNDIEPGDYQSTLSLIYYTMYFSIKCGMTC